MEHAPRTPHYSSANYEQIRVGLKERFSAPNLTDISSPETIIELLTEEELTQLRAAHAALWLLSKGARSDEYDEGMRVFARGIGQGIDVLLALQGFGYLERVEHSDRVAIELTQKGIELLASRE